MAQLEISLCVNNYSLWNIVIRSKKKHIVYLSMESTILLFGSEKFNIKG